jgi:hypothetical protein
MMHVTLMKKAPDMGLAEEFLFGSTTDWTKAGWNSKKNFITREKASCKRYPFSSAHVEQRGVVALADEPRAWFIS